MQLLKSVQSLRLTQHFGIVTHSWRLIDTVLGQVLNILRLTINPCLQHNSCLLTSHNRNNNCTKSRQNSCGDCGIGSTFSESFGNLSMIASIVRNKVVTLVDVPYDADSSSACSYSYNNYICRQQIQQFSSSI